MEQFELGVIKLSGLIIVIPLFMFVSFALMQLLISYHSLFFIFFLPLSMLVVIFILLSIFCFEHLKININNDKMQFEWKPNKLFSRRKIEPIQLEDIEKLVIDHSTNFKEIIVANRSIKISPTIGTAKQRDEAARFTQFMINNVNAPIINSWQILSERGQLKYIFAFFLLASLCFVVLVFLTTSGFLPRFVSIGSLVVLLGQLNFSYKKSTRSK